MATSTAVIAVRMKHTTTYVRQVGCPEVWSCASCCISCNCVSAISALLDEVDQSENDDPDDVHEVPVKAGDLERQRALRRHAAAQQLDQQHQQPDHANGDVRAVEAGQHEESGAEQIGLEFQPLVIEVRELIGLEA